MDSVYINVGNYRFYYLQIKKYQKNYIAQLMKHFCNIRLQNSKKFRTKMFKKCHYALMFVSTLSYKHMVIYVEQYLTFPFLF